MVMISSASSIRLSSRSFYLISFGVRFNPTSPVDARCGLVTPSKNGLKLSEVSELESYMTSAKEL